MAPDLKYIPTHPVPPGMTLKDSLEELEMTQTHLAKRMGRPIKTINEIIQGKAAITADTALQLERVLGTPSSFWLNLEANYQIAKAKADERKRLTQEAKRVDDFPYPEIAKLNWVPPTRNKEQKAEHLLSFLGVASLGQVGEVWKAAYRVGMNRKPSAEALAVWLRKGELNAQQIDTAPYDRKAFLDALKELRSFTAKATGKFGNVIVEKCAGAGVAVAFVPHLSQTYVNGATRWLNKTPLIQLSIRNRYTDIFWFTFFHEAAHLLKHSKKKSFIDTDGQPQTDQEKEANQWACDFLIPRREWDQFVARGKFSRPAVRQFAADIDVGAEIVVGRLQHEQHIKFGWLNGLRPKLKWDHE